jgi:hypothetical protein
MPLKLQTAINLYTKTDENHAMLHIARTQKTSRKLLIGETVTYDLGLTRLTNCCTVSEVFALQFNFL